MKMRSRSVNMTNVDDRTIFVLSSSVVTKGSHLEWAIFMKSVELEKKISKDHKSCKM